MLREIAKLLLHIVNLNNIFPDGLDLEDKTVVSCWSVSWGKLYIDYVNGHKTRDIIEFVEEHNYGFKDPDFEIEDAKTDFHNIEYEEDKEE